MMKRILKGNVLLVIDDQTLTRVLGLYFERKHFNVFSPVNTKEIPQIMKNNALTFAIFYNNSQTEGNIDAARQLISFDNRIAVIFICEDKQQKTEIENADPLFFTIQKPFAMRNLYSRLTAMSNKLKEQQNGITSFLIGNYRFNTATSNLTYSQEGTLIEQHLTKKESAILTMLCRNIGKTVSRHRLLTDIWHKDNYQAARSMDVYITKLRKYLSLDDSVKIENTHSVGFSLKITDK